MTALEEPVDGLSGRFEWLEQSPPELAADICRDRHCSDRWRCLLRDLDAQLPKGGLVLIAEDPLTCVVRGGGMALELMDNYSLDLMSTE